MINHYKVLILFSFVQLTLARYNEFNARYLQPRQEYYYDEESFPADYQNDDNDCPLISQIRAININIIDFKKSVWTYPPENGMLLYTVDYGLNNGGGGPPVPKFGLKVRQMLEVEPPTICPIVEVEILVGQNCFLMWDEFPGSNPFPWYMKTLGKFIVIHTKCEDNADPGDVDNPKRIFTMVPDTVSPCNMDKEYNCLKYKLCPFQNTSCDVPALALSELNGLPRLGPVFN